jgi:hypothetical protein
MGAAAAAEMSCFYYCARTRCDLLIDLMTYPLWGLIQLSWCFLSDAPFG